MKRTFLILVIVILPWIAKAQFYDMGPGSAMWNTQQQLWNMQQEEVRRQASAAMHNYIQSLQNNAINNMKNSVPVTESPYKGHYETRKEKCSSCSGRGYHERMYYSGSSQGNKTIRRDCGVCVGGYVTKREYVLDD